MHDCQRDREDLICELNQLRQRNLELEASLTSEINRRHECERQLLAKEALEESEERLQALMNYNPCLVFLKDEAGKYIYLNQTYKEKLVGSKDWYGKTDFDFWSEESARLFQANDQAVMESGQVYQYMEDSIALDGHRYCWLCYKFPFTDSKNRRYLAGIGIDATSRVLAEEALHNSERRFQALVETNVDFIWEMDTQGKYTYCSPQMEKLWGLKPAQMLGRSPFDLMPPDVKEFALQAFLEYAQSPAGLKGFATTSFDGKGQLIYIETSAVPFFDDHGILQGFRGTTRDITESKKAEDKARTENMITQGINRILRDALICENEEDLGMTCLNVAMDITGSSIGFIGEINPEGLLDDIAISEMGWEACRMPDSEHRILPKGLKIQGIYRLVLRDGCTVLTNDLASHPDSIGLPDGHPPLSSFIAVPLLENGQVIGMIGLGNKASGYADEDLCILEKLTPSIVQVLMRKRAEQAMRESEEKYRRFVETASEGIILGQPDGKVIYSNQQMADMLGYTPEELIGMMGHELMQEDQKNIECDSRQDL